MAANNSYEQSVALIASANRVVQDPNSVGAALRTISLRLRGTSTKELEEAGEDTTGAVESKSKLRTKIKGYTGIDILTDTGAYKSTYDILLEISKVWDDLTDQDQAGLLELIAGKTRSNTAAAILSNTEDLEAAYESAMNAEGSALAENEKYLDSIQGRIDLFNNSVQTLWSNLLDSEWVKTFVDLGTELVKLIDKMGALKTLVVSIGTYFIQKHFKGDLFGGLFGDKKKNKKPTDTVQVTPDNIETPDIPTTPNKEGLENELVSLTTKGEELTKALAEAKQKREDLAKKGVISPESGEEVDDLNRQIEENNQAIQNVQNSLQNVGDQTNAAGETGKTAFQKIKAGAQQAGVTIKAAGKAMLKFGQQLLTSMAYSYIITTVIGLFNKLGEAIKNAWDEANETPEKAWEEFEDLNNQVSEAESELRSLESELENNQDRIEELMSMGTLSFVEQEELDRLKSQSAELETQIGLAEKLRDALQDANNEAAITATNMYLSQTSFDSDQTKSERQEEGKSKGETIGSAVGLAAGIGLSFIPGAQAFAPMIIAGTTAIGSYIGGAIGSYSAGEEYDSEQTVAQAIANMEAERMALVEAQNDAYKAYADDPTNEALATTFDNASAALAEYDQNMAQHMSQILQAYNAINIEGENVTEATKEQKRQLGDILSKYAITMGVDGAKSDTIARIFGDEATDEISAIGKELQRLAKEGEEVDWETLFGDTAKLDAFKQRLYDMGLTLTDLKFYYRDVVNAQDDMENSDLWDVIKQVNELTGSIDGLKNAFSEFFNTGIVSAATLTQLYEDLGIAGTDLAEPWKEYFDVMASGTATTAEARDATTKFMDAIVTSRITNAMTDIKAYTGLISQLEALGMTNAKEYVDALMKKNVADEMIASIYDNGYLVSDYETRIQEIKDKYAGVVDIDDDLITMARSLAEAKVNEVQIGATYRTYEQLIEEDGKREDIRKDALKKQQALLDEDYEAAGIIQSGEMTLLDDESDAEAATKTVPTYEYNGVIYPSAEVAALIANKDLQEQIDNNPPIDIPTKITLADVQDAQTQVNTLTTEYQTLLDEYGLEIDVILPTPDESLDKLQSIFDTLYDAAEEFNENGYLSVDTVQTLLDPEVVDPKYLSLLQDENGQLRLNEQAILDVAKARLIDLGIQRATTIITDMENALNADKLETARELVNVTYGLAEANWDLVDGEAARVAILMQEKGMTTEEINAFWGQINTIKQSVNSAYNNISNTLSSSGNTKKQEAIEAYQKAMEYWENRIAANQARYEQVQNEIDLLEKQGKIAGKEYYEEQIKLENQRLKLLEAQKAEAQRYLNTFAEGSDEWWEAASTLNDIENEIDGVTSSIQDFNDAMAQIEWDILDEVHTRFGNLNSDLEVVRTIIAPNDEEDWFDDEGEWTEKGVTVLGTYVQQIEIDKQSLESANEQLERLSKPYEGNEAYYKKLGIDSEQEYYDKVREWKEKQQEYSEDIINSEQSIVDMYESQVDAIEEYTNKLVDSYNEYIDVVKEALDAERDLYNFKKNIEEKTTNISELERRISSLSGSTDAADIAERRKLEAEYADAKKDLDDTYYDHAMDSQQDALDKEAEAYEEFTSKYIEGLRETLETATADMESFINGVVATLMLNASTIETQYQSTGLTLDSALTEPWNKATSAVSSYETDALSKMNTWTSEEGYFGQFKTDATSLLEAPWKAGKAAMQNFEKDVKTTMANIVSNVTSNVDNAKGQISSLHQPIQDTSKRASSGGSGDSGVGGGITYNPDALMLQRILNTIFDAGLVEDGKWGPASQAALKKIQQSLKKSQPDINVDGKYTEKTRKTLSGYFLAMAKIASGVDHPIDALKYKTANMTLPLAFHAKGTLGTKKDEWAITDESWIGEEITLAAGKNGQLQYLKKGSAVMPADISANLVEWGKLNPNALPMPTMSSGVNIMSSAINQPCFELNFDSLVHVDHCDEGTLKNLEKMVDNKINDFSKQLNYSIKKFAR